MALPLHEAAPLDVHSPEARSLVQRALAAIREDPEILIGIIEDARAFESGATIADREPRYRCAGCGMPGQTEAKPLCGTCSILAIRQAKRESGTEGRADRATAAPVESPGVR